MSVFTSTIGLFPTRRDDSDIELSLPLYNSAENRSSGFLSAASSNLPTSRSASPRPEGRIPRPATPPASFTPPPRLSVLRRGCRLSWQSVFIVVLLLYIFYTFLRPPIIQTDITSIVAEYDGGPPKSHITHLIMVSGHAIWMGGATLGDDEKEWTLLPYQHGLAKTFKQHIEAEFARDSYENLLFSICRFHEYTSNYPAKITVVGFEFKRERFETVHRHAIRYPLEAFSYIGLDNTDDQDQLARFRKGEKEGALAQFRADPHGCVTASLVSKKKDRNPFRTRHGYEVTSQELAGLLRWCRRSESVKDGKPQLYPGALPWSRAR
ncbi:hypothetical protein ABW21_db0204637 [Orbilia brochopaga]|nr:hypothetical protein ABW21_db0204637 [Drechslerella brochopaga]